MCPTGALMTVWSGIWYAYLRNTGSNSTGLSYVCLGCLVTGLVLLTIGMAFGPLARFSRQAELPPTDASAGATVEPSPVGVPTSRRV